MKKERVVEKRGEKPNSRLRCMHGKRDKVKRSLVLVASEQFFSRFLEENKNFTSLILVNPTVLIAFPDIRNHYKS